jgi:hypothetical protein
VAEIYKGKLEAMGVPAMLQYDSAAKLFGLTVDGLGEVRIMVPAARVAEAESLLMELEDGSDTDEAPSQSPTGSS